MQSVVSYCVCSALFKELYLPHQYQRFTPFMSNQHSVEQVSHIHLSAGQFSAVGMFLFFVVRTVPLWTFSYTFCGVLFSFLLSLSRSEILELNGNCANSLRNCQMLYVLGQLYQFTFPMQCVRKVPISLFPLPLQSCLLSVDI